MSPEEADSRRVPGVAKSYEGGRLLIGPRSRITRPRSAVADPDLHVTTVSMGGEALGRKHLLALFGATSLIPSGSGDS
jgi:hypothetical protein